MKKSKLCLVLTGKTLKTNLNIIQKQRTNIDLVELRADFLNPAEYSFIPRFAQDLDLPVILTLRRKEDGGKFAGTEAERRTLLKKSITEKYSFIDLERDFVDKHFEDKLQNIGVKIIRSIHNFHGVPWGLSRSIRAMAKKRNEIPKAAVMCQNTKELYRLLCCFKKLEDVEKILIGMGEYGVPTRILSSYLGSYLCFCSEADSLAARGHIGSKTLVNLYRFININKNTEIYGVIGNPIRHSLSPQIHNRGFQICGYNAVYLPFLVDEISYFFKIARLLPIKGFCVTIPHKHTVLRFLTQKHETVKAVKACNTVLHINNNFFGTNTDIFGFLKPLKKYLSSFKDKRATVIGAGGASRAIVYALKKAGAAVLVLNRTQERAQKLSRKFNCEWGGITTKDIERIRDYSDLIIQTTSIGMTPNKDQDPIPAYQFSGKELVYDIIYNPPLTKLLIRALDAGCKVINGEEMLTAQAEEQFTLFSGKKITFSQDVLYSL